MTPRPDENRRRWWLLVAMAGALSMILADAAIVGVVLPTVQRDLDLSTSALQWVANAYLLTLAGFVAVSGRLTDVLGGVRVFTVGVTLFVLASVAAAVAPSAGWLIAARAAQGFGGALMMPPSLTLVVSAFPTHERGRAVGIRIAVSTVFLLVAPLIGGLLTQGASWRWVFWINLPLGAATLLLTRIARPIARAEPEARMDPGGLLCLVPGLTAVVLATMQGTAWGWDAPATIGLLAVGATLLAAFVVIELRVGEPLVDLRVFEHRHFAAEALVVFLIQFALIGLTVFGAILLQDLLGFTPIEAGLAILPTTLSIAAISPVAGWLYDRAGVRPLLVAGTAIVAGALIWTGAVIDELSYVWLLPGYVGIGIGIALTSGPANVDAVTSVPASLRGEASGLLQLARQTGGTIGLAVIGAVVVAVQDARLSERFGRAGIPSDRLVEVERVLAEDPGSQHAIAARVPRADLVAVLEAARAAEVAGLSTAYYVAGGALTLALLVAIVLLRPTESD
jgi:EmrB/QacA subfamily drug resistance transporter